MHILRAGDYRRMPWKNGKGETVEIAVFPPDASVNDFDWRISMATVATDGPFSLFETIDRTLVVLSGDGIALSVEGREDVDLRTDTEPYSFPADLPATARLMGAPITDLNVMTRRGRYAHSVEIISSPAHVAPVADLTLVVCRHGALQLGGDGAETLRQTDCCILPAGEDLTLSGIGDAFLIRLTASA